MNILYGEEVGWIFNRDYWRKVNVQICYIRVVFNLRDGMNIYVFIFWSNDMRYCIWLLYNIKMFLVEITKESHLLYDLAIKKFWYYFFEVLNIDKL